MNEVIQGSLETVSTGIYFERNFFWIPSVMLEYTAYMYFKLMQLITAKKKALALVFSG